MVDDGMRRDEDESDFLAAYDPHAFAPVAVTVDVVAMTIRAGEPLLLLVRRGARPQRGRWALPGGFVRAEDGPAGPADPDLPDAALRVLAEKTALPTTLHLEQLGTYGARDRDPRMRVFSVAYMLLAPDLPDPEQGRDIAEAAWVPWRALGHGGPAEYEPAFDHARVIADAVERARAKLEYTSLATAFLPPLFTITDLREVYEAVWDRPLHAANFHRKILAAPGFVEDTGDLAERGGPGGGRRPRLYRAGGTTALHPPLLRSAHDTRGDSDDRR
ncbi:NUDIX domain-containing protein [Nocardiopsis sp. N85]|uniref:NUDIX hydrolase n=1 Tax=Nocardiopsis sp. N85 TaxID=3029400 RepID=UPI00237F8E53|nr:NUDIX domain-containing protein [Nocardiopsis sp. N85]MDE3720202.1 NUDIX domain-containing protein [Nocardiopsis sp. N85]